MIPATSFTLCAAPAAEQRIADDLQHLGAAAMSRFGAAVVSILLVGAYARGEGSVVARGHELGPYDDYDLVVVMRDRTATRRCHAALRAFTRDWTERTRRKIDAWPVEEARLARVPATPFWLDVTLGGVRVVAGEGAVTTFARRISPEQVPLDECGRLLAARAAGIALSNLQTSPDDEFRRARHAHEAVLACGDARLLSAGRYRLRVADRLADLESLERDPGIGELLPAYREAVLFRQRPDRWAPPHGQTMEKWFGELREQVKEWHLAYERWRVGAPTEPEAFARWRGRLYSPAPGGGRGRTALAVLRAATVGMAPWLSFAMDPEERLARASVALAYAPETPAARASAGRLLGVANRGDGDALLDRLQRLTRRVD
jgi:predicted nucleotidyltransferase